ncbi:MAG: uroporphyrinogen decarboxylase family protein [Bacteroidales bacterium]
MPIKTEKFNNLIDGINLDSPPLFRPILMHFAARYNGKTYGEFASDHRVLVDCNLRALEDFDMDMVGLISDPYRETSAFGARVSFPAEAVPVCENILIHNYEDVKNLVNPDVYKHERTLDRIRGAELFQKELKGSVPIIGWIEGPLAEACDLSGVSEMIMNLMTDPDLSNLLLDKCVVTAKDFAKAQIEAGADIIGIGDAICSQIDPAMYDEYVLERHREIIDYIHEKGGKVKLHICGNITHLLPSISKLDVDILDLDWQVDMDYAYKVIGEDVIRCGNINPIEIQDLSEEQLSEKVKDLVSREKGRRFILSGGCEITVLTPPENLKILSQSRFH